MPINVGSCPIPFPNISNNMHCCNVAEVPPELLRMRCDPFVRLMNVPTKSFQVKKCENPCAPKDSLDLALSACYDHHRQWWVPRAHVKMQCATYRLFPWGRCQSRLCKFQCLPDLCCMPCSDSAQDQVYANSEPYRNHSSHWDSSIGSPHISNSGRGYGRSTDGLFYNC